MKPNNSETLKYNIILNVVKIIFKNTQFKWKIKYSLVIVNLLILTKVGYCLNMAEITQRENIDLKVLL